MLLAKLQTLRTQIVKAVQDIYNCTDNGLSRYNTVEEEIGSIIGANGIDTCIVDAMAEGYTILVAYDEFNAFGIAINEDVGHRRLTVEDIEIWPMYRHLIEV